jgi:hypothetical protein
MVAQISHSKPMGVYLAAVRYPIPSRWWAGIRFGSHFPAQILRLSKDPQRKGGRKFLVDILLPFFYLSRFNKNPPPPTWSDVMSLLDVKGWRFRRLDLVKR